MNSQGNNNKAKSKANPFMLFMQQRRKELERKGRRFPGGWKEVADLLKEEWQALPELEKIRLFSISSHMKFDSRLNAKNANSEPVDFNSLLVKDEPMDGSDVTQESRSDFESIFIKEEPEKKEEMVQNPLFDMNTYFINDETAKPPFPYKKKRIVTEDDDCQTLKTLNPKEFRMVLQDFDRDEVIYQIKSRFMGFVQNYKALEETTLSCVHFSYYDKGDSPYTYEPAEVAFSKWSIKEGIITFRNSLIDTRNTSKDARDHRGGRRSEKLYVPAPHYTYEMGLAYSFGEDDYQKILRAVYDDSVLMTDRDGKVRKYVFTASPHVEVVSGCLAWLMEKSGDVDLPIRVFPLEPLLQEVFRCAATIRKLREQGLGKVCESPNTPLVARLTMDDHDFTAEKGSLENVKRSVVGPNYYKTQIWDYRVRLGCAWHQQAANSGGIPNCSAMFVRKWTCLALSEVSFILDLPVGPWIECLKGKDMVPRPWSEKEAMGIEMRQRLGLDPVNERRRRELEDHFIFPKVLDTLKKTHPNGLTSKPADIIWPVDRDIGVDLNYCSTAAFRVKDPDRAGTLRKRREKLLRDAEKFESASQMFDIW